MMYSLASIDIWFWIVLLIIFLIIFIVYLKIKNCILRKEYRLLQKAQKEKNIFFDDCKQHLDIYKDILYTFEKLAAEESKCKCQVKVTGIINDTANRQNDSRYNLKQNRDYLLNLETFLVLRKNESYIPFSGRYTFSMILLDLKNNCEVCTLHADIISKPKFQDGYEKTGTARLQFQDGYEKIRTARLLSIDTPIEHERKGHATFLLNHFICSCIHNGCDEITAELQENTRIGIEHLKIFYEKMGFTVYDRTIKLSSLDFRINKFGKIKI
ncbi:MAG: GNAT family N-acetyltransferase [Defluviitaleaceae bacterium]|nr:GNAT family N-acetyltransferase [Defluviitaleaceae bacterium]